MNKIITARPETMSFDKYKELRRKQTIRERRRRNRGDLVYIASQIIEDPITKTKDKRTYMPAVKTFDKYGNVEYVQMKKKEIK